MQRIILAKGTAVRGGWGMAVQGWCVLEGYPNCGPGSLGFENFAGSLSYRAVDDGQKWRLSRLGGGGSTKTHQGKWT